METFINNTNINAKFASVVSYSEKKVMAIIGTQTLN